MEKFYYWGPLLYHTEIKNKDIKNIKSLCIKDVNKDFRKDLAGHIIEEFSIDNNKLLNIIKPYLDKYAFNYKHWYGSNLKSIKINTSWVNFMKSGEYNPPHMHTNCDLSCVIYLDIPIKLKEENNKYVGTLKQGGPGSISFNYGEHNKNVINNITLFPKKGDFLIFPNNLTHSVFPFKSNIERISVSANFSITTG